MTCHWFILMALFFCVSYGAKMALEKQENQINVNKAVQAVGAQA